MKNRYIQLKNKILNENTSELILEANIDKDRLSNHFLQYVPSRNNQKEAAQRFIDWFWSWKSTKQAAAFNIANPKYFINTNTSFEALWPLIKFFIPSINERKAMELEVPDTRKKDFESLTAHFSKDFDNSEEIEQWVKIYLTAIDMKKITPINPLDINWWIKNDLGYDFFYSFFSPHYKKSVKDKGVDKLTVREYYETVLDASLVYSYDGVPEAILSRLKNNEDFDGKHVEQNNIVTDRGYSVILNDSNWLVVCPHNKWPSIFFGKMTMSYDGDWASWCTCKYLRNMYADYAENGFQYIIIDKGGKTKYNIQFSNNSNGNKQDIDNDTLSTGGYDVFPFEVINGLFEFEYNNNIDLGKRDANIKDFAETLSDKNYIHLHEIKILEEVNKAKAIRDVIYDISNIGNLDKFEITPEYIKTFIENTIKAEPRYFTASDDNTYQKYAEKTSNIKIIFDKYDSSLYAYMISILTSDEYLSTYEQSYGPLSYFMINYIIEVLKNETLIKKLQELYVKNGWNNAHQLIFTSDSFDITSKTQLEINPNISNEQLDIYFSKNLEGNGIRNITPLIFSKCSTKLKAEIIENLSINNAGMSSAALFRRLTQNTPTQLLIDILNTSETFKNIITSTDTLTESTILSTDKLATPLDRNISKILDFIIEYFNRQRGDGKLSSEHANYILRDAPGYIVKCLSETSFDLFLTYLAMLENDEIVKFINMLSPELIKKYITRCISINKNIVSSAAEYVGVLEFKSLIETKIEHIDDPQAQSLSKGLFDKFKDEMPELIEKYIKTKISKNLLVTSWELELCDQNVRLKYIEDYIRNNNELSLDVFDMCPVKHQHLYVLKHGWRNIEPNYYDKCKITYNPDGTEKANLKLFIWREYINNGTLPDGYLTYTSKDLFKRISEYFYSKERGESLTRKFKTFEEIYAGK